MKREAEMVCERSNHEIKKERHGKGGKRKEKCLCRKVKTSGVGGGKRWQNISMDKGKKKTKLQNLNLEETENQL